MLLPVLCVGLLLGAPPPKKAKPAVAAPAAPKSPLSDVKVGDFVEYELSTAKDSGLRDPFTMAEQRAPMRLRLQAVEVTADAVVIDVRPLQPTSRRWLAPGLSFEVLKTGTAPPGPIAFGVNPVMEQPRELPPFKEVKVGERTVRCRVFEFDNARHDGPKGSGCDQSPDASLALGGGVVESHRSSMGFGGSWKVDVVLVAAGQAAVPPTVGPRAYPSGTQWTTFSRQGKWKKLERNAVSSAGGKLVFSVARFDQQDEDATLTMAGFKWKRVEESAHSASVLEALVDLLDDPRLIHTVPAPLLSEGPPSSVGPTRGATRVLEVTGQDYTRLRPGVKPEQRLSFYAEPEQLLDAPLPVRFGILEQQHVAEADRFIKIIEWR